MARQDFSLFDNLIEGIHILSPTFDYVYANKAFSKQILKPIHELIGNRVLEKFPRLENTPLYVQLETCMKKRTSYQVDQKYGFKDGTEKWFDVKVQPFENGLLIMSNEITKTKEIEESLKDREQEYQKLFEQMQEFFLVQEAIFNDQNEIVDLKLLAINSAAAGVVGKKPKELVGQLISKQLGPLEGSLLEVTKRVVLNNESVRFEKYLPQLDRWLKIHSYSPKPNRIASLVLDITESKMNEFEWEKLNLQLDFIVKNRTSELAEALGREQKLSMVKSNFLSMAAHELKTPLSAILLIVSVLDKISEHGETDEREKYHRYIEEQTRELLKLLDSFVAPFHQEIGGSQLENETFDFFVFLEKIGAEFQRLCAIDQQILIQFEGERIVELDKRIIRRIIINLLTNAIKYSQKDVIIQANIKDEEIILKIIDHGIGIPLLEQKEVFTPYFRAKNASDIQGTGLGLNIVKTYVDLMGGMISFESEENKGTTFTVRFLSD